MHRDIKPGNIMVTPDGTAKVLDFGLAKLTEPSPDDADATATVHTTDGAILGTVSCMSPEQAEGRPVDARTDIFAFGALLYKMLTGWRAFEGGSKLSTLAAVLHQNPPPMPERSGVPREFEKLVMRCLRNDPDRRFQHMADVKVALEDLKEESESGRSMAVATGRPKRRAIWPWLFGAAAGVAFAVASWLAWRSLRTETPAASPTFTRVTQDAGLTQEPAISPDGKLIAYASDRGTSGNLDIWVQQLPVGQAIRRTARRCAGASTGRRSATCMSQRPGTGCTSPSSLPM